MIKTYNPKELKKWMEYSSLLVGIIIVIYGIVSRQSILLILGFFFILAVSNKTKIIIDEKGILITTTTLFLMKRKDRLNFKEMDSVMRGWKGRKILIDTVDLSKLIEYIKDENPDLTK